MCILNTKCIYVYMCIQRYICVHEQAYVCVYTYIHTHSPLWDLSAVPNLVPDSTSFRARSILNPCTYLGEHSKKAAPHPLEGGLQQGEGSSPGLPRATLWDQL